MVVVGAAETEPGAVTYHQTDFFGEYDVATVRTNARKEAWSRRSQSANFQAEALSSRPWLSAGSTLLTGAGQVASRWYEYTRGR